MLNGYYNRKEKTSYIFICSFSYFEKHKKIQYPEGISRYEIRKSRYLCFEKQKPLKEKPSDYSKRKYRTILTINNSNTYSWIKKIAKIIKLISI